MTDKAANQDRHNDAGDKPARPGATFFKRGAQLLDQGRTNTVLAKTDNMEARLKVYASGGENALHTHFNEDHMFVIMQGLVFDVTGGYQKLHSFVATLAVPGPAIVKVQADAVAADTVGSGGFDGVLAQDALMDRFHG